MTDATPDRTTMPANLQFDWQEGIHQAVDIGFSIADLIGGLFSDPEHRHTLARRGDTEGGVLLGLSQQSTAAKPVPQIALEQNAGNTLYAVVTPATTQVPDNGQTSAGPLYAGNIILGPGAEPYDLTELGSFSQGLFTASLVDSTSQETAVPLAGLTARGALLGAQGVPLLSGNAPGQPSQELLFNLIAADSVAKTPGSIQLVNNTQTPLSATFTVMTGAPNQSFTVPFAFVQPGSQTSVDFPVAMPAGTTFQQLNAVAYGPPAAIKTFI